MAFRRAEFAKSKVIQGLLAEVTCLLQAKELLQGVGNERRSVWVMHGFEDCIRRDGSPTGIP
jgi:hypothetical protein